MYLILILRVLSLILFIVGGLLFAKSSSESVAMSGIPMVAISAILFCYSLGDLAT